MTCVFIYIYIFIRITQIHMYICMCSFWFLKHFSLAGCFNFTKAGFVTRNLSRMVAVKDSYKMLQSA